MRCSLGLLLVVTAFAGTAHAIPPVPEIDPGSASGALALLAGGFFLVAGSRRQK